MASENTPDEVGRARFRTVFRGFDPDEVLSHVGRLSTELESLRQERDRLANSLGEFADRDLETEFDSLGREVAAVLQAAREAAESMRERATLDSARWRAEAMAEVEDMRKEARSDAEALRGDAWATGTEMLNQAVAEARRIRAGAERDVLTTMGEAEREAHRLTSSARREAEDALRAATMDAEKLSSEAKKRHDEMIDQAHRQAEAAQERTRALEERREELMEELETVRATLGRLEGTLEERREVFTRPEESSSVRIVPPSKVEPDVDSWALGETVRIIPPDAPPTMEREVSQPKPSQPLEPEPIGEPEMSEPIAEPVPVEPEDDEAPVEGRSGAPEPEEADEEEVDDSVGALFASLRGDKTDDHDEPIAPAQPVAPQAEDAEEEDEPTQAPPKVTTVLSDRTEMIEERDGFLLPITNRALRGVKKSVTDAQNIALDSLRTDGDWSPDAAELSDMLRADLIGLWSEAYAAGHNAAEEMVGAKLKRPVTPSSDASDMFGGDLASAVEAALVDAGDGQREKQSATSRVYRGWRTDEAERRVRLLALEAYHRGLRDSAPGADLLWVPSGTPCSACREASADPDQHLPPVHVGCECTVVID
ncbi:MAG: DivIVA domain-containing protein [Acidimicrobiia bacterium]